MSILFNNNTFVMINNTYKKNNRYIPNGKQIVNISYLNNVFNFFSDPLHFEFDDVDVTAL